MEAGFLNFRDGEHFEDFSLSLDHQHNLLGESQSTLVRMVDSDFDYVENLGFDSNDALWETEQELNGDLALLPVSGVAGVIPKMENIKEDFAKVLTDWQEHIGYLQASEIEEDINLDMGLHINDLAKDIFEDRHKSTETNLKDPVKLQGPQKLKYLKLSPVKCNIDQYESTRISESDQSEKEIDVVGLDSVEDVNSIVDFMHVGRQHASTTPKENISKSLGKNIEITEKLINVKDELSDLENEIDTDASPLTIKSEYTKDSKKKYLKKKCKEEVASKKNRKSDKEVLDFVGKISKKSKKDFKSNEIVQETSSSRNISSTSKKVPVLEAGDVKSLLEQFEATEAASDSSQNPDRSQLLQASPRKALSKFFVNKSQVALFKKLTDSQDSKFHQDIRDSLPKEVIDRIKASSDRKKISVIPAILNVNTGMRNNGTRIQEAASSLSRNNLLKLVTNSSNSGVRIDGSVQLDHDYCSKSNSIMSTNSNSCDSNSEYDRQSSDSEQPTPIKQEPSREKHGFYDKGGAEHSKSACNKINAVLHKNNWADSSSKKDSGLESGDVSDASEEQTPASKVKKSLLQDTALLKDAKEQKMSSVNVGILDNKLSLINKATTTNSTKPIYEMKIQSALATSILQLRKGVLTKTKTVDNHKPKQMVSVLKKPPVGNTLQKIIGSNLKESIVTTTNSSNNQVQNIIVQETVDIELPEVIEKKPPRRKLNLAEYRSRREQNRSDGSRTNSPIQPMTLLYIHHASTSTDPVNDDSENPIWSEREIVSVLKPKAELEEEKLKPKRPTRNRGMQTTQTVFGIFYEENKEEEQKENRASEQESELVSEIKQKEQIQKPQITKEMVIDSNVILDASIAKDVIEKMITDDQLEVGEIIDDQTENNDIVTNKVPTNGTNIEKHNEDNASTSINRLRDRKHRNYRRTRVSSGSSRSRSRSHSRSSCSGARSLRRMACRNRTRSRSRSRKTKMQENRSRTRSHSRSRSRSRSSSSDRSRSRSRSRSRTCHHPRRRRISHRRSSVSSTSSWSSRSRSRSRSKSRSRSRSRSIYSSTSSRRSRGSRSRSSRSRSRSSRYSSCSRSPPPSYRRPYDEWYVKEKQRQVEERRVIYVGRLKEGITKAELRRRFEAFGPVVDISIHFRERGHNYGFVTFAYKNDAYEAVEHGNDDPSLPRYDLCFGGRRAFCKVKYADLDGAANNSLGSSRGGMFKPEEENTFDLLLKEAQAKLRKRKV